MVVFLLIHMVNITLYFCMSKALKKNTAALSVFKTGLVTYLIQRAGLSYATEEVTITITSQPREGADPIAVNYRTESTNMYFSTDMLVIILLIVILVACHAMLISKGDFGFWQS